MKENVFSGCAIEQSVERGKVQESVEKMIGMIEHSVIAHIDDEGRLCTNTD